MMMKRESNKYIVFWRLLSQTLVRKKIKYETERKHKQ
jgi:hypothetical protein